jgi:hypothetical protein
MNDALEILDEIEKLVAENTNTSGEMYSDSLLEYIQQKRLEFVPASGDCCG